MQKNFIEELRRRGMIHDVMPGTEEQLLKELTVGYIGFDPTAPSLHIGSLLPIMLLKHFQLAGHKPIALVGGATGMVGDPSGKSAERTMLSEEVLQANVAGVRAQLAKFLDFDCGANSAELVNNYDWTKDYSFLGFLRDIGKHLTVNYMMAKDSVKKRLETGISFTEFSYQLLQGFDFYHLYQNKHCKLQMGGSDQWGNITTGTELIRRKVSGEAYALTCPLLTRADGQKFGKSEGGNVWLDAKLTSPYKFYQFWLNVDDADLPKLMRFFTLFSVAQIEAWEQEHATNPNALKRLLAEDVTRRVHSEADLIQAQKASNLLFGKATLEDFATTDEAILNEVFEGIPQKNYTQAEFAEVASLVDLLSQTLDTSKGEVRKLIKNNGLSVNQAKVSPEQGEAQPNYPLLKGKYLLIKKGKNFYLVSVA
ncbi:MAG: tyrosine--tRNA ligase [Microscillaceae bacterium]|jgi:tyrosyl-tRNA synthetase|nr:tyrosine--tRNA ligase [Microscillaceae bacterium]